MQESGYNLTKTENMQLIFTAKCGHNLESALKEYSILKKIVLLDQPITTRPMQLITQKVSHIKKPWNIITNQLERHYEKRDRKQQSIESGLTRMSEKDIILTCKKIETAYFIAKDELPLTKFKIILALEELHNVE